MTWRLPKSCGRWAAAMLVAMSVTGSGTASAQQRIGTISYYEGHAGLLIRLADGRHDAQGCQRNDFYILPRSQAGYADVVSMIVTAAAAKQPVTVGINGCSEGFPRIAQVTVAFGG